jgi:hypothetical protein
MRQVRRRKWKAKSRDHLDLPRRWRCRETARLAAAAGDVAATVRLLFRAAPVLRD